jgi:hypothetical protein
VLQNSSTGIDWALKKYSFKNFLNYIIFFPQNFKLWYETTKHDLRLGQKLCLDSGEKYPHLSKCHEMGGTQDWKHSGNVSLI